MDRAVALYALVLLALLGPQFSTAAAETPATSSGTDCVITLKDGHELPLHGIALFANRDSLNASVADGSTIEIPFARTRRIEFVAPTGDATTGRGWRLKVTLTTGKELEVNRNYVSDYNAVEGQDADGLKRMVDAKLIRFIQLAAN